MKRKLMILGAGIYQVPLIQKASQMGLETLVVSIPGNYPGFAYADRILEINTTDSDAILAAAEKEQISGIVTTGTDVAVRSIGRVCDALHLRGISEAAAVRVTDKAEMKRAFDGIVSSTQFRVIPIEHASDRAAFLNPSDRTREKAGRDARNAAEIAAEELGYPVMVKAADVSGSRGVTRVNRPEELGSAVSDAIAATRGDHILIEKVAEGYEIGLDAFIENGRIAAFFPHRKFVCRTGAVTLPGGHAFPLNESETVLAALRRELENIVRATGIDNCAVNCDIMIDGERIHVIEAGGRCGATCIPELIERHTGIDYYAQMIRNALGEPCDFTASRQTPCGAKLLFSEMDGVVRSIDQEALQALRRESGASISLDVTEGERVEAVRNGTSRIGQVILDTDDEAAIDRVLTRARESVAITPDDKAADEFQ